MRYTFRPVIPRFATTRSPKRSIIVVVKGMDVLLVLEVAMAIEKRTARQIIFSFRLSAG